MFCKFCGKEIEKDAEFCPFCNNMLESQKPNIPRDFKIRYKPAPDDKASIGLSLLGFFFPLIGLIGYIIEKYDHPQKSKSCIIGALAGFIVKKILIILVMVFYFSAIIGYLNQLPAII